MVSSTKWGMDSLDVKSYSVVGMLIVNTGEKDNSQLYSVLSEISSAVVLCAIRPGGHLILIGKEFFRREMAILVISSLVSLVC